MARTKKVKKTKTKKTKKKVVSKTKKKGLTAKQEKFCQMFAKDRDCFGNGTQSYLKVFSTKKKPITYKSARTRAYLLLTKVDITDRIRELIDLYISDEVVDKELGAVIQQWGEIPSKVAAIREYNRVKGRIAPEKVDITIKKIKGFNFIKPNEADDNSDDKTE